MCTRYYNHQFIVVCKAGVVLGASSTVAEVEFGSDPDSIKLESTIAFGCEL